MTCSLAVSHHCNPPCTDGVTLQAVKHAVSHTPGQIGRDIIKKTIVEDRISQEVTEQTDPVT